MKFANLEIVVLMRDIPESGLRSGDIGTVVEVYPEGGLEVEFVRASGETQALLTPSFWGYQEGRFRGYDNDPAIS